MQPLMPLPGFSLQAKKTKNKKQNKTKKYSAQKQILMVLTLQGFYLHIFLSSATYTLSGKESWGGGWGPEVGTPYNVFLCMVPKK